MGANTKQKIKPKTDLQEPPLFKVIYINDDKTEMSFVVESLVDYFGYTEMTAEQIMMDIHNKGSAVVAVLPYQLAEQKGVEVTVAARSRGYPLQIKIEPATS